MDCFNRNPNKEKPGKFRVSLWQTSSTLFPKKEWNYRPMNYQAEVLLAAQLVADQPVLVALALVA